MNRSRSLVTAVDVSMTVNIIASPGAMSTLQAPSPGRPEVPGSVYSSRNPSPSHGNFHSHFRTITDDQLHALKGFDTQFLIDDSGSMKLQSSTAVAKGRTHWEEVKLVLLDIVKVCAEFDENGVDVFFFNSSLVGQFNRTNIKEPKEVMELFEARSQAGIRGSTPTAEALDLIISPYLQECERSRVENRGFPKPKNVIILTDGAANNNKLLKQNLISYARRLDTIDAPPDQIGVQFFQVGNVEGVDDFLTHLDNALSEENECRDFIDTRSSEEMGPEGLTAKGVLTTVLGGVIRRLDNATI
ncbi:hypothetical protein L211DRAFT_520252 [Terfezia boudieri ATCC MYA-4762]|uniref:VWFA domain-containing protein n=1 Tax=Terfezia boudieri ATCC MYA-4762 TaxID=1051890 RepID=A0A3N4LCN9_9PEZI|nr:hypothetical protein L211DRAFT_520252 [Terfezia boudieri ATCC MYA-4762]